MNWVSVNGSIQSAPMGGRAYTHDFAGRLRDEAGRGRAIKAQQRRSARTGALLARAPIVSPVAAMRIWIGRPSAAVMTSAS
jgi:hypothetical protein